jgi:hypothetical protein
MTDDEDTHCKLVVDNRLAELERTVHDHASAVRYWRGKHTEVQQRLGMLERRLFTLEVRAP